MKKKFIPDQYQQAFLDFVQSGEGNAIINAVAGAGKSRTTLEAIKLLPTTKKVLLTSFNVDIAKTNREKLGENHYNVFTTTLHALGRSIVVENEGSITVEENKYKTYVYKNIEELSFHTHAELGHQKFIKYCRNIIELTNYSRFNLCETVEDIERIAKRYGITLIDDECYITTKVLSWGKKNTKVIDYTDMIWLPIVLHMVTIRHKYDYIFIDEAQDTTPMAQALIDITKHENTRFFAVGDEDQCINAWAGADKNAFAHFLSYPNTQRLEMPNSYRCAIAIVKFAQMVVPRIRWVVGAEEGIIVDNVSLKELKSGDLVLCRTNLPLFDACEQLINMNMKVVMVRNEEVMNRSIKYIEETKQEKISADFSEDGVIPRLYEKLFFEIDLYIEKTGSHIKDALTSNYIAQLYEDIKIIEKIAGPLNHASDLIDKIKAIYSESNGEGIRLSTIHKAKGLEADNAYLLCPSLMPSMLAKQDWELEEERNLDYVARTRAKRKFGYISEVECPPADMFRRPDASIAELEFKRGQLENCLAKADVKTRAQELREKPIVVEKKKATRNVGGKKFSMFN